ncbi:hypothetical protein [Pedobacter ginsengisoli]|uniref:hypothetical protein n=1 Tax=Pedobacter ginsengisoli TaxID=363852 RepID=UPI00255035B5|nr:hypothetical protein [Pedobacter ginsengisoli]
MRPAFKILYHLENGTHHILEIKRTDLNATADLSDVYKWLYIDKGSLMINQLWFKSMDSSGHIEERFFEQGYLKFNSKEGTFIEKFNSAQHQLINKSSENTSPELTDAIEEYLAGS